MTNAAAAVAPIFTTPLPPATIEAALDSGPLFSRGASRDGVVSLKSVTPRVVTPSALAPTPRHPRPTRFAPLAEVLSAQLLLPFPTHGLRPRRIKNPEEARALVERLGNATHYLQHTLASKELPSMTIIRTLARFILETEMAQLKEVSQRDVNHAKLLVLQAVLRYEDSRLSSYPSLVNVSEVRTFLKKLAGLVVGLDRITSRYETSQNPTVLEALLRLEKSYGAVESLLPWAKSLFPVELRASEARLAHHGLKLKDLIARGQESIRMARAKLYRINNGLPPLVLRSVAVTN